MQALRLLLLRLCVALSVVVISCPVTWYAYWTAIALGWVGLGVLILSLAGGPSVAVLLTRRLFAQEEAPRVVPVVLGAWLLPAAVMTVMAFWAPNEALVAQLNPFAVFGGAMFTRAFVATLLPARADGAVRRSHALGRQR